MKIGLLIIANGFSGAERIVYDLCDNLLKSGQLITLFVNEEALKYYQIKNNNYEVVNIGAMFNVTNLVTSELALELSALKLQRELNQRNINIFHVHSDAAIRLASRINVKNIPLVITLMGEDVYQYLNSKKLFYRLRIKKEYTHAFEKAAIITSLSKWQVKQMPIQYLKKTVIIGGAYNKDQFYFNKNIIRKDDEILFVGRLIKEKGVEELLYCASKLTQYKFKFAGKGPLAGDIRFKNTYALGFKTTDELRNLYSATTVCVFPSYREAFGLVGLEAMACGAPVIATAGYFDYLTDHKDSILVKAGDKIELLAAISEIMSDEVLRIRLSNNGRKTSLKYDSSRISAQYLALYNKLLVTK